MPFPRSLQLHPASAGVHFRRFIIDLEIRDFVVQMVLQWCSDVSGSVEEVIYGLQVHAEREA